MVVDSHRCYCKTSRRGVAWIVVRTEFLALLLAFMSLLTVVVKPLVRLCFQLWYLHYLQILFLLFLNHQANSLVGICHSAQDTGGMRGQTLDGWKDTEPDKHAEKSLDRLLDTLESQTRVWEGGIRSTVNKSEFTYPNVA